MAKAAKKKDAPGDAISPSDQKAVNELAGKIMNIMVEHSAAWMKEGETQQACMCRLLTVATVVSGHTLASAAYGAQDQEHAIKAGAAIFAKGIESQAFDDSEALDLKKLLMSQKH